MDRSEILALPLARREVDVPEWGGPITVREITAGERGQLEAYSAEAEEGDMEHLALLRPRLVVMATLNGEGMMFDGADVELVAGLSPGPVGKLSNAIMEMSGLGVDSLDSAEKNLPETPAEDSPTS